MDLFNIPFFRSYEADLGWLMKTVRRLEKDVKDWKISLKEYVLELLSDHPEWIQNWMLDDGSITYKKLAPDARPPWGRTLAIGRYGRILDDLTNGSEQHLELQSVTNYNGMYITAGYTVPDQSAQRITSYTANGIEIASALHSDIGHGQGLDAYNGYAYITDSEYIRKIDLTTLATVDTMNTTVTDAIGLAIDRETGTMYVDMLHGSVLEIAVIDIKNDSIIDTFTLPKPENHVLQGMTYNNGYLYILCNMDNQIMVIDIANKAYKEVLTFPDNDGWFYIGEPEDLCIVNEHLVIAGAAYSLRPATPTAVMMQLFMTDACGPVNGMYAHEYRNELEPATVTVDGEASYSFNPISTFTCLDEVNELYNDVNILIKNIDGGTLEKRHGLLSITGVSGTRNITNIYMSGGGNLNVTGVSNIDNCQLYNVCAYIVLATINNLSAERSEVELVNTVVNSCDNANRTIFEIRANSKTYFRLNMMSGVQTSTQIHLKLAALDINEWSDFYAKLLEMFQAFNEANTYMALKFIAMTGATEGTTFGIYKRMNAYRTATAYTINGKAVTVGPNNINVYPGAVDIDIYG